MRLELPQRHGAGDEVRPGEGDKGAEHAGDRGPDPGEGEQGEGSSPAFTRPAKTMTMASRGIADVRDAERMVRDFGDAPRGLLRVSAPGAFAVSFLTDVVCRFMARWPEVDVEVLTSDRRVDLVEEGVDLAVRVGHLDDSSLVVRRLGTARGVCIASPDYLAAHGTPEHPSDLAGHTLIGQRRRPEGSAWPFVVDGRPTTVTVRPRLHLSILPMVRDAALSGTGIAYLPRFIAAEGLRSGRLVPLLEDFATAGVPLSVVFPSRRQLSPKVRAFVDQLVADLSLPPWEVWDAAGG